MIGAIQNSMYNTIRSSQRVSNKTAIASYIEQSQNIEQTQDAAQAQNVQTSIDGDTLTISSECAAYLAQNVTAKSEQETGTETKVCASTMSPISSETASKASASMTVAESHSASSESSEITSNSTLELSGCTKTELEQMLRKGDITQAQYDKEVQRRNGGISETE